MKSSAEESNRHSDQHPEGVAFLLAQIGGFAVGEFAKRIAEADLTAPEAGLLRTVGRHPGRSQQEIASELGVHPSRMVAFIDDLEGRGLVERHRDLTDRRRHAVRLTAAGRGVLNHLRRLSVAHDDAIAGVLGPGERTQLRVLLCRVADAHGLRPGVHPGYSAL